MASVIPRSYIENYSKTLNLASEKARESLVAALTQLNYSRPVAEIRDAVISIMQVACGASTDVAARLAADFYDGLRVRMVGESLGAVAESMRNPDATDGAIRAFIQIIVDGGDSDAFIGQCASRLDYETRRAANLCTFENAKRDPLKPKWARIPAGDETCEWCIMLASRGFAYSSKEAASHSHANCDCRVVPSWDKDNPAVQGYDPDLYYDMWKHPEKYEKAQEQDSGIEFSLGGIKNADVVRREINNLANEYHTPLLAVSEAPPAMINERMHEAGKAELYTGTAVWLKNGSLQTANHEFGHTLWSSKRDDEYKQNGFDEFEKELKKLWRQYRKEQDLNKRISAYSTENIDEFFADGFAAYKTGRGSDKAGIGGDSPYAQAIGELADKYFKKH